MKPFLLLALTLPLAADVVTPDPFWKNAPTLKVECDGYTLSADCMTGTIVYFVDEPPYGLVPMTRVLPWYRDPAPSIPESGDQPVEPPAYEATALTPVVVPTIVPEPGYRSWMAAIGALLAFRAWIGWRRA